MKKQDEKKVRTMQEEQPEEFAFLLALHAAALERMEKPDFVQVLPPPEDKSPGNLIYAWGLEMLRLGLDLGTELMEIAGRDKEEQDG